MEVSDQSEDFLTQRVATLYKLENPSQKSSL